MNSLLACKLSKASQLAYSVNKSGSQADQSLDDALTAIGFALSSIEYTEKSLNGEKIDACYYADASIAEDNDAVVLAFRGTLPPTLAISDPKEFLTVLNDWLNDANFPLVTGQQLAGLVHEGFLGSLDRLWPDILAFGIKEAVAAGKNLYITGHSKGGGLAYLAAYRLARLGIPPTGVYTFAAPRVGNGDFAGAFDTVIQEAWRFEYRDDIAPHIPPDTSAWLNILQGLRLLHGKFPATAPHLDLDANIWSGFEKLISKVTELANSGASSYVSAGTLQYFDTPNAVNFETDSIALTTKRNLGLAVKMAEFKWDEIIKDHSGAGATGYYPCN